MPLSVEIADGALDLIKMSGPQGEVLLTDMMTRIGEFYKLEKIDNWFVSTLEQFERIQKNKAELPMRRSGEIMKVTRGRCILAAEGLKSEE